MKLEAAFFDTSALVPLCYKQAATDICRACYEEFAAVVWWGTNVECESAFTRLVRTGELAAEQSLRLMQQRLKRLQADWIEIEPSASIRSTAVRLLHRHPLRAADAIQLAAALEWRQDFGGGIFISGDQRLLDAARQERFVIRPTTM